ncbi:MAG: valine--tRNA ligase [Coriobacteriales bacterium]|jgi:valyl-tRNA synthetase|nr:valine--tRNA ligase [Coriobacteriales bacterium]
MNKELPKTYDPGSFETELFTTWSDAGYFKRDAAGYADASLAPYTIVIPPPNVTGVLHMGHALNNTLQDILIRKARMQGKPTRWIVGTDHAGIATQNRVEQKFAALGKTRFDLGREDFVAACWDWCDEYGSTIIEQLKAMGCSCDFSDEQFTMSPGYARAIRKVFVDWYKAGLIYRGYRIINWCPRCTTALADDEVEHKDEQGHLWHLRYPLVEPLDGVEYLVVATTRPETMLGDTGVAVNPNDERYKALLAAGAQIRLPLVDRIIPLFADDYVDAEFGTGAVKVTPAHDPNDFDMGKRAELEQINVFDEHAVVNELGGQFAGKTREEAREAVVAALDELGLLEKTDEHDHAVGHCYRCDTTIEPWLSDQWFVAMRSLAEPAIAAVRNERVVFHPRRWENVYFRWLENIRDWCISRQLWWGHRIPVFYCDACGWSDALEEDTELCPACGEAVRQDEDVLDTWFSSQLWPFATQGWAGQPLDEAVAVELAAYYPTQVLSTARDIIFLWVARMIMSSLYFIEDAVPFTDVIIHPTVLDKHGNIMSKSRGNGIDPLELISEYSADGMRFGLALQVTGSQDMKFDKEKLASSRNFATKLWNAARFVLMNLEDFEAPAERVTPLPTTDADRWILSRLARLAAELDEGKEGYDFGAVARALYNFFWNEFCDWYIEFAKGQLALGTQGGEVRAAMQGSEVRAATQGSEVRAATQRNLVFVLDSALRLLHPFMPFITEKIWQSIPHGDERPSLMIAQWCFGEALAPYVDEQAESTIGMVCTIVSAIRSARARYQLSPKEPLDVVVRTLGDDADGLAEKLGEQEVLIKSLANTGALTIAAAAEKPAQSSVTVASDYEIYVVLEGLVDFDKERTRLSATRTKTAEDLAKIEKKLANEGFINKAAAEIIEKAHEDAAELTAALEQIDAQLASLD